MIFVLEENNIESFKTIFLQYLSSVFHEAYFYSVIESLNEEFKIIIEYDNSLQGNKIFLSIKDNFALLNYKLYI